MDVKCPICNSNDIVEPPFLPIPNAMWSDGEGLYKRTYESKMCNNCRYLMIFCCPVESKKEDK